MCSWIGAVPPPGGCELSVQLRGTMAAERKIFVLSQNVCVI